MKINKEKKTLNDKGCVKNVIYYVYIIECERGILYTGVTTDYKRRFDEHAKVDGSKKGAKFTKSHKPVKIVALWKTTGRSNAQKLESKIKKLSKDCKLSLVSNNKLFNEFFGDSLDTSLYKRKYSIKIYYSRR